MREKCLAQEHNTMTRPGLEPGPLNPESDEVTTSPLRLPPRTGISPKGHFLCVLMALLGSQGIVVKCTCTAAIFIRMVDLSLVYVSCGSILSLVQILIVFMSDPLSYITDPKTEVQPQHPYCIINYKKYYREIYRIQSVASIKGATSQLSPSQRLH